MADFSPFSCSMKLKGIDWIEDIADVSWGIPQTGCAGILLIGMECKKGFRLSKAFFVFDSLLLPTMHAASVKRFSIECRLDIYRFNQREITGQLAANITLRNNICYELLAIEGT
jgi:hypothetical protein